MQYATMMAMEDEMGNTPFQFFLKTNGSDEMALYLMNRFDDKTREEQRAREAATSASGKRSKSNRTIGKMVTLHTDEAESNARRSQSSIGSLAQNIDEKIMMLFTPNKNGEIALVEEYAVNMKMPTEIASDFVYEYISSIKEVHVDNVEWVKYCLLFAAERGAMARIQLIIEKVKGNEDMLKRVLKAKNKSNHDALYRLVATGKMTVFSWLLDNVPDDHECLDSQSLLRGDTVLMRLLEGGQLILAERLLIKINDDQRKLQLLNSRRLKRIEGG